jgi:predicted amidophosphoribosyltransferase
MVRPSAGAARWVERAVASLVQERLNMALVPCPSCRKPVDEDASACPHCGYEPPNQGELFGGNMRNPKGNWYGCVLLIILIIAGFVISYFAR